MNNYICIEGKKIELSEESVKNIVDGLKLNEKGLLPEIGEWYWYICYDGEIYRTSGNSDKHKTDQCEFEIGNYFKSREDAERHVEELKAIERIKRWKWKEQGDWELDFDDNESYNFYIRYWEDGEGFVVGSSTVVREDRKIGFFKSLEIANKCIKECENDLKIIFGIEE